MPISALNNSIELAFYWDGDIDVLLGLGQNATKFPFKIGGLKGAKMGQTYTVPIDLSSVKGWEQGDPATIQAVCHQPGFDIYQCVDVVQDLNSPPPAPPCPSPSDKDAKLIDSLVEHISVVGGCNVNTEDLPQDALSRNLAALWYDNESSIYNNSSMFRLRAAFHDVGKWRPNGPIVQGLLGNFVSQSENKGIDGSLATLFAPKGVFNYSAADLIAVAGQITVQHCGGPQFNFTFGRQDGNASTDFYNLPPLPDDEKDSFEIMKKKLYRLGFTNQDIVALVTGSHSMGGAHGKISPHITNSTLLPFDSTPGVFDNDIFKALLDGKCRLRVDCGIANDPDMLPFVQLYANDQEAFFKQFVISFQKMISLGKDQVLRSVHLPVPVHENLFAEGRVAIQE